MLSAVVMCRYLMVLMGRTMRLRLDTGAIYWLATDHPGPGADTQLPNPNQLSDSNWNHDPLRKV